MARSRRRRGRRIRVRHPVFFESPDRKGAGTLVDVSYSGAFIENHGPRLSRGDRVLLYLWPERQAEPFELVGHVASVRDDGFAVEYEQAGQEICQWIDALPEPAGGDAASEAPRTAEAAGAAAGS